jgi:hypothetical protein
MSHTDRSGEAIRELEQRAFTDLMQAGRTADARNMAGQTRRAADKNADPATNACSRQQQALLLMQEGLAPEVERAITAALDFGTGAGWSKAAGVNAYQSFLIRRQQGRAAEVRSVIEQLKGAGARPNRY